MSEERTGPVGLCGPVPRKPAAGAADSLENRRWRIALAAASAVLVALPFLAVTFPPITDLPQQAAQIRLAGEALTDPATPYRIQWWTPYVVSYLALGTGWAAGGPLAAGRLGMLLIALAWVGAAHRLAARRNRPAEAAVLASTLAFNQVLYWGFYSFAVGWPAFVLWVLLTVSAPRRRPAVEALRFLAGGALLYACHALWFAAGGLWLGVWTLARPHRWREAVPRVAGLLPVVVGAAFWYRTLEGTSFDRPAAYFKGLAHRLSADWLEGALYGGLRSPVEKVMLVLIAAYFLVAIVGARGRLAERVDRPLALAGGVFLMLGFTLPDQFANTIQFEDRWMPGAVTLLLLAAPALPRARRGLAVAALAVVALFTVTTAAAWRTFEREEMSGLSQALAALPPEPRVLGLAFVRESRFVDGLPFLQTFAYAQVVAGGELNFSFAEFAPSLVVYRTKREHPWTTGLEWYPEWLRVRDLLPFDHAMIGAPPDVHGRFAAERILVPQTDEGVWRLYRIDTEAVTSELERLRLSAPAASAPETPGGPP